MKQTEVRWSEAARALGGLALAERRWYLVIRVVMVGVLAILFAGHFLFGLALRPVTAGLTLAMIVPPTILGIELQRRERFTDPWLLLLLGWDIVVLTIGNHWSGGVESSFGYSYLAVVLASALFLDRRQALLCALACAAAYDGMVIFEYEGIIAHHDFLGAPLEHNLTFVVYECMMKALTFGVTSLVATAVVHSARKAYARLEDQERRMRQFAAEALSLQDAESRRIARELHDGAGQALTAARLHLQAATNYATSMLTPRAGSTAAEMIQAMAIDLDSKRVRDSILATARLLDAAMDEVRRSAAALGPTRLDELGLVEALRRHCEDLQAASRIPIRLHGLGSEAAGSEAARPPAAIERAAYRIAQEALTNALRHAHARHIDVQVVEGGGAVGVEVRDDGDGFDPSRAGRGLGLSGMRDRVALLGGTFTIDSAPGQGTRIRAVIPIHHEASMI